MFGTVPRLPVLRLPPAAPLEIFEPWCHITFGTDRFTRRKLGVPCLKIVSTMPKIWRAVPIFLARVNGVLVIIPGETSCIARSRDEIISL